MIIIRTEHRVCKICEREFKVILPLENSRKYCQECSPSGTNPTEKFHAMKNSVIKKMGGKCCICGYNKCVSALEFHHKNKDEKEFTFSNKSNPSFEKMLSEACKCILVCCNCHREIHSSEEEKEDIKKRSSNNSCKKPVAMLDKDTEEYIMEFESLTNASEYLDNPVALVSISEACKTPDKVYAGYKWRFI